MYYFQNQEEIIADLDNYMDTIHFSDLINREIVNCMKEGKYRLTLENYEEELNKMENLSEKVQREYMPLYYE